MPWCLTNIFVFNKTKKRLQVITKVKTYYLFHFISVWFSKPAVSIGNVGQLAVDLVVSTVCPDGSPIGYLYDSCVLPVVGNDAFTLSTEAPGKLNVSVEGLYDQLSLYLWYSTILFIYLFIYSPLYMLNNLCKLVIKNLVVCVKWIFITSLIVCLN